MSDIDIRSCIPKNKSDNEAIQRAVEIGYPAIKPILYELLMWLQDPNWPLAGPVWQLLKPIGLPLIPHIKRILRGTDGAWKHSVLCGFVVENREFYMALQEDIKELCENPSEDDRIWEVDALAKELMEDYG